MKDSTSGVVLTFSGGLDSTVLLYYLKYKLGSKVRCLSIDYGQRHRKELDHATQIARLTSTEYQIADLRSIRGLLAGSSQTSVGIEVPEGHYAEESMKQTIVPNRNMILLSLATAWAISTKSDAVAYAAHAGDHAIYPDCKPEFIRAMEGAIAECDWSPPILIAPFKDKTKAEVVKLGHELQVPFHLTWSCYKGGDKHCGKCGTCTERKEAFQLAGVTDPTEYE